jgi:hypothetical protein
LKAALATCAVLATQTTPAIAQDVPAPRLIAVGNDDPGWRPVEIILSDASRSLSNANKAVCGDKKREAELRRLRAKVRMLLEKTQRAIGDVQLIIPMDGSAGTTCDSYPALVASARTQMDRVEALLPSLARR